MSKKSKYCELCGKPCNANFCDNCMENEDLLALPQDDGQSPENLYNLGPTGHGPDVCGTDDETISGHF